MGLSQTDGGGLGPSRTSWGVRPGRRSLGPPSGTGGGGADCRGSELADVPPALRVYPCAFALRTHDRPCREGPAQPRKLTRVVSSPVLALTEALARAPRAREAASECLEFPEWRECLSRPQRPLSHACAVR